MSFRNRHLRRTSHVPVLTRGPRTCARRWNQVR